MDLLDGSRQLVIVITEGNVQDRIIIKKKREDFDRRYAYPIILLYFIYSPLRINTKKFNDHKEKKIKFEIHPSEFQTT